MKKLDKASIERYRKKLQLARSNSNVNPFETLAEQKIAIENCKKSFRAMVQRYFPHYATADVPDFHIEFADKVKRKKAIKAFAQWGRAQAKSVLNDVLLPFWLWLNGEPVYLVIVGNSLDRAQQLLEDIRSEFEANPQIINDFGEQHNPGSWEAGFFVTRGGFIGQALGMGQSVRGLRVGGKRPTHIVCDDIETKDLNANQVRQLKMAAWIERDLIPTMDGSIRRFILANNKFSPRMVQTILQDLHPDWWIHQVNAYDPVTYAPTWSSKYDENYFKEIEQEIGVLAARAEYNNEPHVEGTVFKNDDIQYAPLPRLNSFKIIFGFWDVAYSGSKSADYNAVVVQGLHGRDFWELDCFVQQCKMNEALDYMCAYQKLMPETVVIHWVFESQFWNDAVRDAIRDAEVRNNVKLNIIKRDVKRVRKYDRMLEMLPYFQQRRYYYNEKLKHKKDHQVGIAQLLGIEPDYKGKDDYPDAKKNCTDELEKYISSPSSSSSDAFMSGKYKSKNMAI
jgi:hypothetical protein